MRFNLEVDLDQVSGGQTAELARILRYWAGSLTDDLLEPGAAQDLYDSTYTLVGRWTVIA